MTEKPNTSVVLPVLAVTQFLMTVDSTVMNVSIPALVDDFDTSVTTIQGVITAYTLVMAAAMITGGKLGDILGRRRALRIGLVVYACGSGLTAISPSVGVLLVGWSVLEGLGASLIMPTVVALIAGNFTGAKRAAAYGTIAASAAVAAAVGPIIGGFVTSEFSWRWVFAAEVVIAFVLLGMTSRIPDVASETKPQLDLVGAALSAAGLALVVFGVLQSGAWGWIEPNVAEGPDATPAIGGISLVTWLVLGGLAVLFGLVNWLERRMARGADPLFDPTLLANAQVRGGLVLLVFNFIATMGLFFMVPLFLSIVVGLSTFETGLRMLPLSIALVTVAPAVPRFLGHVSPRRLLQAGFVLAASSAALLAGLLDLGSDASIVFVPFVLMGAGLGLLASQIGNVIVSAVPEERSSEVGGLQYTAQNLGASLGTALVGSVVLGALGGLLLTGLEDDPDVSDAVQEQITVEISAGVDFVSDDVLEDALAETTLSEDERTAIVDANASARIGALQQGAVAIALLSLVALFFTRAAPSVPFGADDQGTTATAAT